MALTVHTERASDVHGPMRLDLGIASRLTVQRHRVHGYDDPRPWTSAHVFMFETQGLNPGLSLLTSYRD